MRLTHHPLVELFPPMPEDEYASLRDDIRDKGLLTPITLGPDGRIVDGRHRYRALCELGLQDRVEIEQLPDTLSNAELIDIVVGLNVRRRHLKPGQRAMAAVRLLAQNAGRLPYQKSLENACAVMQVGQTTLRNAQKIFNEGHEQLVGGVEAGDITVREGVYCLRLSLEDQGLAVEAVRSKEVKTVREAARRLQREQQFQALRSAETPSGQFRCIVAHPPWPRGRIADAAQSGSDTVQQMRLQEIEEYVVPAADDCVLWLWASTGRLEDGFRVVHKWGFDPQTVLTWAYPRMGSAAGRLRVQTEHCIMGVRGKVTTAEPRQYSTLLHGPIRPSGAKPETFYELVETLCPGSKCEVFAKEKREGWTAFFGGISQNAQPETPAPTPTSIATPMETIT
jgi:N6-adenosine-specific RNA methylase IME4